MTDALVNLGWAVLYMAVTALVGVILILLASLAIPRILSRLTPAMDEDKEIARGNRAVAEYFGRLTAATILGTSIIIAAAILGGILFAVHPS